MMDSLLSFALATVDVPKGVVRLADRKPNVDGLFTRLQEADRPKCDFFCGVEPSARTRWQLDDPLRQSVLLSGLLALQEKRFEQAADRFREASKLGLRDKRLGGLITLALVKAGQRLLYSEAVGDQPSAITQKRAEGS